VCVCVCVRVCVCVCVCVNLWPWLGPPVASLRYVMHFRFMDDVIFAHT